MNKDKLILFNTITNFLILSILFFGGIIWADSNGVWHRAADVQAGIFGSDEGDISTSYIFQNPVNFTNSAIFNTNALFNQNLTISNSLSCGKLYTDSSGKVFCGSDNNTQLTEIQVDNYVSNNGYLTSESDPTVPANIKDGISWNEISDIKAGLKSLFYYKEVVFTPPVIQFAGQRSYVYCDPGDIVLDCTWMPQPSGDLTNRLKSFYMVAGPASYWAAVTAGGLADNSGCVFGITGYDSLHTTWRDFYLRASCVDVN